ncbi:MAG: flavin monoamine oxidase family protein [Xanthobacteraceae bacterium]
MPRLSRRSFLAASAGFGARPALGAPPPARSGAIDVVIVGAGAAGISAARRLAAAGRHYVLIEAAGHLGGRCITETGTFGVPFDRGAHWIHLPDKNPVAKLTPGDGIEIYPAPQSQKVRIGLRYAREGELEDFLAAQLRATRAIDDAARKADVACGRVLPGDLGDWQSTIAFVLGPFPYGRDLAQLSAADFAHAPERNADAFCRQGFGTLLATRAAGLAVQLSTPATAIDFSRNVEVQTPKGAIAARAAIITVSANVLAAGGIRFKPELSQSVSEAFNMLSLGSYDHIALEFNGNPLGLESDDLVFEKSADTHTAAILGNVYGTSLCLIEVAGSFGRELSAQGQAAMVNFAGEWLAKFYGNQVIRAVRRASATRWNADPLALGAMSAAKPGGHFARAVLAEPVHEAIWFAGDAVHETLWGTVGGAWESGERAADAVLRRLAGQRAPEVKERRPARKRRPIHHRGAPRF